MDSLNVEITQFQRIIDKYNNIPEYVNPKYSLQKAQQMLQMLQKELYLNTKQ